LNTNQDEKKIYIQIPVGDKNFNCRENMDYYKRLSMDSNKLEVNGFYEISDFLKKIGFIQCNIDNCLFGHYKNNKLYFLLTLYVIDVIVVDENKEISKVVIKIKYKCKVSIDETTSKIIRINIIKTNKGYKLLIKKKKKKKRN